MGVKLEWVEGFMRYAESFLADHINVHKGILRVFAILLQFTIAKQTFVNFVLCGLSALMLCAMSGDVEGCGRRVCPKRPFRRGPEVDMIDLFL